MSVAVLSLSRSMLLPSFPPSGCCRYAAGVDGRGGFTPPLSQLPPWIQQSLVVSRSYGDAHARLARFFQSMAAAEAAEATAAAEAAAPAAMVAAAAAQERPL